MDQGYYFPQYGPGKRVEAIRVRVRDRIERNREKMVRNEIERRRNREIEKR